jgi:Rrf2 family protein
MQLTRAADYAVRAMIHLATLPQHQRALLPTLARATGAPTSFLSKVLQRLCAAGYVASWRGKSGGFEILPEGRRVNLRALVEAIEGPIHLNSCLAPAPSCGRKSLCPAHPVWARAQEAMIAVLEGSTVAELAAEAAAAGRESAEV